MKMAPPNFQVVQKTVQTRTYGEPATASFPTDTVNVASMAGHPKACATPWREKQRRYSQWNEIGIR